MNIVLFDGVCNLCNSTVLFLIKLDTHNNLLFAAQQSEAGIAIMKENHFTVDNNSLGVKNNSLTGTNSVIFIKEGRLYYKSDAIIEIAKLLTGWPRLIKFTFIFPKWFRDGVYDLIAKYRYKVFGIRKQCMLPSNEIKHKFL